MPKFAGQDIQALLGGVVQRMKRSLHQMLVPATFFALALVGPLPAAAHADDARSANVEIIQFGFQPTPLEIAAGTTVTWTNHDAIVHSVTNGVPEAPGDAFDSGLFDQGLTFTQTFAEPGEYTYFCARHNFMRGSVIVS